MQICESTLVSSAFADGLLPDRIWLPTDWGDEYRIVKTGPEPGPYNSYRLPFVREPVNRLSSVDPIKRIVWMKGSRVGVTDGGIVWIGSEVHAGSGPIMISEPTQEVASRVSKTKLGPMLLETPVLAEKVATPRSRDASNTILYKEYAGTSLSLLGMNSGSPLREADALRLFMDEVDGYPGEIAGEGDPVSLLERRTKAFGRRAKIFMVSTPKIEGRSRIQKAFLRGDRRRYLLPCPACGHLDFLTWDGADRVTAIPGVHHRIHFENRDARTACMRCSKCDELIPESYKEWMLATDNGARWEPTCEATDPDTSSYHISTLYSPWETWQSLVTEWFEAKDDPPQLMVHVNTVFGETYEDRSQDVGVDDLQMRKETYAGEVPDGVGILVTSIDVQKDRLEVLTIGWGAREECWIINWTPFFGDTAVDRGLPPAAALQDPSLGKSSVYYDVDQYLKRDFKHQSGRRLKIERVAIDSNYESDMVYRFCRRREKRILEGGWVQRVHAVRGGNEIGKPVIAGRPRRVKPLGVLLFTLCTDTAKDIIYSRLRIPKPEAGVPCPAYTHFNDRLDDEFFAQIMAETKRHDSNRYEKVRPGIRNEALDLMVYNLAALYIGGPELWREIPARAARWAKAAEKKEGEPEPTKPKKLLPPRRRGGWISSIRGR